MTTQTEQKTFIKQVAESNHGRDLFMLAALFNDTFSIDWLVDLTGFKASIILEELQTGLSEGALDSPAPGKFRFKKREIQKNLLDQLTPDQRRMYQQLIFSMLVRELPDDDQKALILSEYLYDDTLDTEKAVWLKQAGSILRKQFELKKAEKAYVKILTDLASVEDQKTDQVFIQTALSFSSVCEYRDQPAKIQKIIEEAARRATNRKDTSAQAQLELIIARCEWIRGHQSKALKRFEQGSKIIDRLQDPGARQHAARLAIRFLFNQGLYQAVVDRYQDTVLAVEQYPYGGFILGNLPVVGYSFTQIGQLNQGLGLLEGIRQHSQNIGNSIAECANLSFTGTIMLNIAHYDEAIDYIEKSIKIARKSNDLWMDVSGSLFLAYAFFKKNDLKKAHSHLKAFLKNTKNIPQVVHRTTHLLELGWAIVVGQLSPIGGFSLVDEIDEYKCSHNIFLKGVAYRYQALIQKREGAKSEEILKSLDQSSEFLNKSGAWIEQARTVIEKARMLLENGKEKQGTKLAVEASQKLLKIDKNLIPEDLLSLVKSGQNDKNLLENVIELMGNSANERLQVDDLKSILLTCNQIAGAERGGIFLNQQNEGDFQTELIASRNLASDDIVKPEFAASLQLIAEVCQTGKEFFDNDLSAKPGADHMPRPIRSRICLPIKLQGEAIGALYHDNRILNQNIPEANRLMLSLISSLAALIIKTDSLNHENVQLRKAVMTRHKQSSDNSIEFTGVEDIVGQSENIREVIRKTNQVAGTDTAVLILGETGVGKDLVAHAIHNQSLRHDKPFIKVHCSALPESLITSELFGHEKGAFTGASARRIGRFEQANGGTIFLDEIGELPLEVQVRLLRVLQNQEFERVGSGTTLRSDFRLVAATNRDLEKEVAVGRFRSDLYFRINVFPILVPPLRDRTRDIPLLAQFFMQKNASALGKTLVDIPPQEKQKLVNYQWPGNIRELQNVIERAAILSPGPSLTVPLIPKLESEKAPVEFEGSYQDFERRFITNTLHKVGWKVRGTGGAADILGLPPSTLDSKIKKLKIQRPSGVKIKRNRA